MVSVFLSYSHRDEELRNELQLHLEVLLREGRVDVWYDRRMLPGQELDSEIDARLNEAQIILLLVSHHFLASQYCYEIEFARAKQRHEEKTAQVIPIILSECDWKNTPISKFVVLPKDGKPVTKYPDKNEAFLEVVQAVRAVAISLGAVGRPEVPQALSTNKETPRQVIRSSNLRIRKSFSDHDRDLFLHETFDYISNLFQDSLTELSERYPEIKTSFRKVDNNKFDAAIYRNGQKVSSCQIRIEGRAAFMGTSAGIAYSMDGQPNSYNDFLQVEEGDQSLFMKTTFGGLSFTGSNNSERELTPQGAAEHYWSRLIEPLQKGFS